MIMKWRNKKMMFINIISLVSCLVIIPIIIGVVYDLNAVPIFAQGNINNNNISLANLIKDGCPHLGSPSAPITVIDFSDFQCHLRARYVKATEPKVNETYVQTGKANLVFKHLPCILGKISDNFTHLFTFAEEFYRGYTLNSISG